MKVLVAGITGQLGHGLVAVSAGSLRPVVRPRGPRTPDRRLSLAFGEHPALAETALVGDVTQPLWGLSETAVRELAGEIDAVINVAAETNWAAPRRRLHAVNTLGAATGLDLAQRLFDYSGGRCRLYCYASSVHAAGGREGTVSEQPLPHNGGLTDYEYSKWAAETHLLKARRSPGPRVLVARIGGLVGDSVTGHTVRRNSFYMLADEMTRRHRSILPIPPRGRVDVLPRDHAAELLWRAVVAALDASDAPEIVHCCAGEDALFARLFVEAMRIALGDAPRVHVTRQPLRSTVFAEWVESIAPLLTDTRVRQLATGLRYLSFDRVFARDNLRGLIGQLPPQPAVEAVARLVAGRSVTSAPVYASSAEFAFFHEEAR